MNYLAKWGAISREMYAKKIVVLAVQETHLDQAMTERLQETFKKNLKIIISAHPENPCAKVGVGFVINRQLLEPNKIETYKLIPGKAMILKIKWMKTCTTSILNIYAPNKRSTHPHFWVKTLTKRRSNHLPIPDFTLGDFNVTEEAIDRMPPRLDDGTAVTALKGLKQEWEIRDTWRWANPTELAFMYRAQIHNKRIQARLD